MDTPAPDQSPRRERRAREFSLGEEVLHALLRDAHLAAAHELPDLIQESAAALGLDDAIGYLADLQQEVLVPMMGRSLDSIDEQVTDLSIETTLAGRAYQHLAVLHQDNLGASAGMRVWLPLLDGSERLGVLGITVPDQHGEDLGESGLLGRRLRLFANVIAELVMTKTMYGDTIVRLRRRGEMGLAAEMQWSLLPPLTFACNEVIITAALEPAYYVAGDSVDYAVNPGIAHVAIFDGMGHGLRSAQLATLAVAAYRNGRRSDHTLAETASSVDAALVTAFGGEAFTTGVLGELDTNTGRFSWINAGHPPPLLIRAGRVVKILESIPAVPLGLALSAGGVPGGAIPADGFIVGSEQLEPEDLLLFYTDGVIDARSPDGGHFGLDQMVDLVTRHLAGGLAPAETMRRVVRALLSHQQGQLTDDATLLLVEWRHRAELTTS